MIDARQAVAPRLKAGYRRVRGLASGAAVSSSGLFFAVLFLCASLTPSLLPRTWQIQGVISGVSAAVGYGFGVALGWVWQRFVRKRLRFSPRAADIAASAATASVLVLLAVSLFQGWVWQRDLHNLMGMTPPGRTSYLGVLLLSAVIVAGTISVARLLRFLVRWLSRFLRRWIPPVPAQVVGVAAVALLTLGLLDGVVLDGFMSMATATSRSVNESIGTEAIRPTSTKRSGGPESLVSWDTLGRQGRSFVSGGPTLAQLRDFGGPQAKEPIRVYVGLQSAPSTSAAAALAVRELDRTGAFSRSVLCVVTTTGTGWVDPYLAAALEYMHNGDTAIVGTQFSYLPSWISFLSEQERVAVAGRDLFDAVYATWSTLPPGERPLLLVFAESLGSLGSEASFRDLADVRAKTDGVVWAGPTNDNPLWNELVAARDPGSTEVLPTYQHGAAVRFASRPTDLDHPAREWDHPRVVYLQNPSDPVTWWTPRLAFQRPDWLEEPRGYDVLPAMRWYPVVTFLQVTADLALAEDAPPDHGHRFHRVAVAAWAAVAPPAQWSDQRTAELTRILDQMKE